MSPGSLEFDVLIPARLGSTRLPDKALADLGGRPVVVHVADAARRSGARNVWVATDSERIAAALRDAGHPSLMTRADHPSGTDRLAEAASALRLQPDRIVVNVQGDEPEMPPELVRAVAQCLRDDADLSVSTAAHPIHSMRDWMNPNVVKVVRDEAGRALYFSRAPVPWDRDALARRAPLASKGKGKGEGKDEDDSNDDDSIPADCMAAGLPLRHIGIYGYRARFLHAFAALPPSPLEQIEKLEQLRALHHGHRIGVHVVAQAPRSGIDTPADLEAARMRFSRN